MLRVLLEMIGRCNYLCTANNNMQCAHEFVHVEYMHIIQNWRVADFRPISNEYNVRKKNVGDGHNESDAHSQTHGFGAHLGGVSFWLFIIRANPQ
jgi:hypothetical protein